MPDYSMLFTSGNQPPQPLQQSQALFVQNRIAAKQKEDEARAKQLKSIKPTLIKQAYYGTSNSRKIT